MSTTKCVKLHFLATKDSYGFKNTKSASEIPGLTQDDIGHEQSDKTKLNIVTEERKKGTPEVYKKIDDASSQRL